MKNVIYKLIPIFSLCVCMLWCLSITVFALVPDPNYIEVLKAEFELGDTAYYYAREEYTTSKEQLYTYVIENSFVISDSNKYMCFYLVEDSRASSGYTLKVFDNSVGGSYNKIYVDGEYSRTSTSMSSASSIAPNIYRIDTDRTTTAFHTNIPIFPTLELAEQYAQGLIGVDSAVNYKKEVSDTGWVKPFEDIEINDSDILVPDLTKISHTGFTLTNCNNDLYLVEIYMESGLETPENYINGSLNVEDALFVNNYGLITDNSEAYWNGPVIDIAQLYGVDNYHKLIDSINNFYSTYSCANDYFGKTLNVYSANKNYYLWGKPFGKQGIFFTNSTKVTSDDLVNIEPLDIPFAYTQYRVRYFYYDEDSGYHYGPWAIYTYFSDGHVNKSGLFQSDTGDLIETPTTGGTQDDDGNISYVPSDLIDLNNPNELFGYIRSLFNNMTATNNTFSQIFAAVFNFLPPEILAIIFGGIAGMVFIGIAKALIG